MRSILNVVECGKEEKGSGANSEEDVPTDYSDVSSWPSEFNMRFRLRKRHSSSTESLRKERSSPRSEQIVALHEPSDYYAEGEYESECPASEFVFEEPANRNIVPTCGFTVYQPKFSPWWLKLMDFGDLVQLGEFVEY